MNGTQPTPEYGLALVNLVLLVMWIVAVVGAPRKWRTFFTVLGAFIAGCLIGSTLGLLIFHNTDALTPVFGWLGGFGQALFEINASGRAKKAREQREANHP